MNFTDSPLVVTDVPHPEIGTMVELVQGDRVLARWPLAETRPICP